MRTTNQKIAKFCETETSRFFRASVNGRIKMSQDIKNREVSNVNAPIVANMAGRKLTFMY